MAEYGPIVKVAWNPDQIVSACRIILVARSPSGDSYASAIQDAGMCAICNGRKELPGRAAVAAVSAVLGRLYERISGHDVVGQSYNIFGLVGSIAAIRGRSETVIAIPALRKNL